MKVLIIDEWIPLPLDSGKKIRTFSLLQPLMRDHDITLLCYADTKREASVIEQIQKNGVHVVPVRRPTQIKSFHKLLLFWIKNINSNYPLVVNKNYTAIYKDKLQSLLKNNTFDLIQCEWTHYGIFFDFNEKLPLFLSSHNIESMQWKRFYKVERNPLKKIVYCQEWKKMTHFEKSIVPKFDHISAVSNLDAHLFKNNFKAKSVQVIPNGVDLEYYENVNPNNNSNIVVFSASMDAFVNQDAVYFFLEQIMPKLKIDIAGLKFMILGSNPPHKIKKQERGNVIVTGTVKDVRPYLRQASIMVVPLRIAGGSRLKILEGFASSLPVISTSIGAEGLDVIPEKHLLIAETPEMFVYQCKRLIRNDKLRQKLIENGKQLVKNYYQWQIISKQFEKAWEITCKNYGNRSWGLLGRF